MTKAFYPMATKTDMGINEQILAHSAAQSKNSTDICSLDMHERGRMIESACEAAAAVYRSRLAAGLPDVQRDPWPESTREFFRKQAARVRG